MEKWPETLPELSQLNHEQKDAIIRALFPLIAEVKRLTACVAELEARLSKDSHNSSKPPSSAMRFTANGITACRREQS